MDPPAIDTDRLARPRPGGRSARVRAAVLAATLDLLDERGFDGVEVPEVARRAAVHPTTVYRRWGTRAQLVGEALLDRGSVLTPTPDTGALRTDLERLVVEGAALLRTPSVRALFEVLLSASADPSPEIAQARDRFWAAHVAEARGIVDRAVGRSELPAGTDPAVLVELVVGPALAHLLLRGRNLGPREVAEIVGRALTSLTIRLGAEQPRSGEASMTSRGEHAPLTPARK